MREPGIDLIRLYKQDAYAFSPLAADSQQELIHRAQRGDKEARNTLVASSQALVLAICSRHTLNRGEKLLEYIQEANLGLMHAIAKYDASKGAFSTYAVIWIRSALQDFDASQAAFHFGNRGMWEWKKVQQAVARLGQTASIEALSAQTGFSVGKVRRYLPLLDPVLSLEQAPFAGEEEALADVLADASDAYAESESKAVVDHLLARLTVQERAAFQLMVIDELQGGEVAKRLHISRQRVSQLCQAAREKLRVALGKERSSTAAWVEDIYSGTRRACWRTGARLYLASMDDQLDTIFQRTREKSSERCITYGV